MLKRHGLVFVLAIAWAGCGGPAPTPADVEKLTPEPSGAPVAVADGRLSCLGANKPPAPTSDQIVLPGWTRFYKDPIAKMGAPAASVEAFSETGVSLGKSTASSTDGRVALTIPVGDAGYAGHIEASYMGLLDYHFWTNRPYTRTDVAGWAWMMTKQEADDLATNAGVQLMDGTAIAVIAMHDCDGFGVGNAVIQVNGSTKGGVYVEEFKPVAARTFTAASGRIAWPNLAPGPATIKAFGRMEAGGPLILLASAQVTVKAGTIVAVDLQPRVANK